MTSTTLRVILDQAGEATPRGVGRYALELTRALIATAPRGCDVAGIVPASPTDEYDRIAKQLPGLAALHTSTLDRRQLAAAWQHGFTPLPGEGMLHAPSLLAPLRPHNRRTNPRDQTVVTIHDATAFTHPELLPARTVSWTRAMAQRAERYADAIVVPTHAVADELSEHLNLADRVRVIPGAVSSTLTLGDDSDDIAMALDLPERYVLAVGTLDARSGIDALVHARLRPDAPEVPLLVVGIDGNELDGVLHSAGAEPPSGSESQRVRAMGVLSETDLAVAYSRAALVVAPEIAGGTGLVALKAMSLGAPVVHSDSPALREVCADAGLVVDIDDAASYPERLSDAMRSVLDDPSLAADLAVRGRDRDRAFSWRDSAEKTWQLHADL